MPCAGAGETHLQSRHLATSNPLLTNFLPLEACVAAVQVDPAQTSVAAQRHFFTRRPAGFLTIITLPVQAFSFSRVGSLPPRPRRPAAPILPRPPPPPSVATLACTFATLDL